MSIFSHAMAKMPHITMEEVEEKGQEILFKIADDAIPNEKIVDEAADKLVAWLDEQVSWGTGMVARIVDSYDQILLKWLAHMVVHRLYEELHTADAFGPVK